MVMIMHNDTTYGQHVVKTTLLNITFMVRLTGVEYGVFLTLSTALDNRRVESVGCWDCIYNGFI